MNKRKDSVIKSEFLSVRLTPDEKENLTILSDHLGVSTTSIIRKAIISEIGIIGLSKNT